MAMNGPGPHHSGTVTGMSVPPDERLSAGRVLSHLGVMSAVAVVTGVLVAGLAIPFAGVVGVGARDVARSMDNLPAELAVEPLAQKTRIIDGDGNLIASLYDENRVNVPLTQISRTMIEAIVSIEDYRFYEHGAVDLRGTLRALVTNQAEGGVVQGGSSITQQMVKLTLVSQAEGKAERVAATDDTLARKIRELRYAIAFEEKYSKDWILERYLNIAYFGDGAYGIQSAARHYFDKNAKDLDLRESAMLAGLVKNPTGLDPTNSPDAALERRNVVLDRMAQLDVVSPKVAKQTRKADLGLDEQPTDNGCVNSRAPFFCDYVINTLMQDPSLGETKDERRQLLRSGGLTISTTVDLRYQAAADKAVQAYTDPTDQAIGSVAMVEPGTGEVKAISQSRPMGSNKEEGQTYLNYVVPQEVGDAAGFQAGSTFKAFVLAQALMQGVQPDTTLTVPAQEFIPESQFEDCDGPYGGPYNTTVWDPVNFDASGGTYDLYSGTQNSVNTFFANLEQLTGICKPYELAKNMGVDLTNPAGPGAERIPSFTLGVADVSPLEMAESYATFAARGQHCDSRPVTSIEDANGNLLKEYGSSCTQVLTNAVADTVNDILKGVLEPGGFGESITISQQDAGKTGTTQEGRAVWFNGYTPNLSTAAMLAGANSFGQPIELVGLTVGDRYISEASGSGLAGPIWGQAMGEVEQWLADETFTTPDLTALGGAETTVPSVAGLPIPSARGVLENAGFNVLVGPEDFSEYAEGTVAYSDPGTGAVTPEGSVISVYPSTGFVPAPQPTAPEEGDSGGGDGGDDGGVPPPDNRTGGPPDNGGNGDAGGAVSNGNGNGNGFGIGNGGD